MTPVVVSHPRSHVEHSGSRIARQRLHAPEGKAKYIGYKPCREPHAVDGQRVHQQRWPAGNPIDRPQAIHDCAPANHDCERSASQFADERACQFGPVCPFEQAAAHFHNQTPRRLQWSDGPVRYILR